MKLLWVAAVALVLSTQGAAASDRLAFWDRLATLPALDSLAAYEYLECAEPAAKDLASKDKVTPVSLMGDSVAKAIEEQCAAEGAKLFTSVDAKTGAELKAIVHRISWQTLIVTRNGGPTWACASEWHGCPITKLR
ncbi:MAG: hypothetical protein J2P50_20905 [Hyphomicrobiaceae bacterium]|nr:hypothetical protein [Hyphomicrobiaceae bacterium]